MYHTHLCVSCPWPPQELRTSIFFLDPFKTTVWEVHTLYQELRKSLMRVSKEFVSEVPGWKSGLCCFVWMFMGFIPHPPYLLFFSRPENVREFKDSPEKKPTPVNMYYPICVQETERKNQNVFQSSPGFVWKLGLAGRAKAENWDKGNLALMSSNLLSHPSPSHERT